MFDKKKIILPLASITLFIIIGSFLGEFLTSRKPNNAANLKSFQVQSLPQKQIMVGDTKVSVNLAITKEEKAQGLSGVRSLREKEGLLFVFSPPARPSFWMKGMLIPIDIIWISDSKVIGIEKAIPVPEPDSKESELRFYLPPEEIEYVLEVNAGFSDKFGVFVGDEVDLSNIKD